MIGKPSGRMPAPAHGMSLFSPGMQPTMTLTSVLLSVLNMAARLCPLCLLLWLPICMRDSELDQRSVSLDIRFAVHINVP